MVFSNTGCSKKSSEVILVTTGLSFTADITDGKTSASCSAEIAKNGDAVFTVTAPEEIKGMTFNFTTQKNSVTFLGLTQNLSQISQAGMISEVYNLFKDLNKTAATQKDDKIFAKKGSYTLFVGATGLPISLKGENGLTVTFSDVTILQ